MVGESQSRRKWHSFSVRDLFWLTVVVGFGLGWFIHFKQSSAHVDRLLKEKADEQTRRALAEIERDSLRQSTQRINNLFNLLKRQYEHIGILIHRLNQSTGRQRDEVVQLRDQLLQASNLIWETDYRPTDGQA